jgi:hypothetical protein
MVYADDVNILGESINTIERDIEVLLRIRREVGLEVNTDKTMPRFESRPKHRLSWSKCLTVLFPWL